MAQAREIEQLKREIERLRSARRDVPNTAAADLAGILNSSNANLQSDKNDLSEKNAALNQQISAVAQRNTFLEAELASASHLLQQMIPGEQDVKLHITLLQSKNKTLEQEKLQLQQQTNTLRAKTKKLEGEKLVLQQRNHNGGLQQNKLLTEHTALHDICHQWSVYSAQQGAEIVQLKETTEDLHGSLVRKSWRLHTQKTYLDRAGLVVKEFEEMDEDAIRAWAAENLNKILSAGVVGVGNKASSMLSQTTKSSKETNKASAKQVKLRMQDTKIGKENLNAATKAKSQTMKSSGIRRHTSAVQVKLHAEANKFKKDVEAAAKAKQD